MGWGVGGNKLESRQTAKQWALLIGVLCNACTVLREMAATGPPLFSSTAKCQRIACTVAAIHSQSMCNAYYRKCCERLSNFYENGKRKDKKQINLCASESASKKHAMKAERCGRGAEPSTANQAYPSDGKDGGCRASHIGEVDGHEDRVDCTVAAICLCIYPMHPPSPIVTDFTEICN